MNTRQTIGDCCNPCDDPTTTLVPGPQGADGADGAAGADGISAFTYVMATFTMPAVGSTVSVTVGATAWMAVGQYLFIEVGGVFQVSSITDATTVVLENVGAYGNVAPAVSVNIGSKVSPGGMIWDAGNGMVIDSGDMHFAQIAPYTAGEVPFAHDADEITFDDEFVWEDTIKALGLGKTPDVDAFLNIDPATTSKAQINFEAGIAPTTPSDGDLWYSTATNNIEVFLGSLKRRLECQIFSQTADKAVVNTTDETSLFGTGSGTLTLPANWLVGGSKIRIRMAGTYEGDGAIVATFKLKLGATSLGTFTITMPNLDDYHWELDFLVTCRTVGATGTVRPQGGLRSEGNSNVMSTSNLATVADVTVDTTGALAIDVTVDMSAAVAGDGWTCTNAEVLVA